MWSPQNFNLESFIYLSSYSLIIKMEKNNFDFTVVIEQDEDGIYVANVPELEGCYTQGKTLESVLERIKEAIEVCLEGDREETHPMTFVGIQKVRVQKPISV